MNNYSNTMLIFGWMVQVEVSCYSPSEGKYHAVDSMVNQAILYIFYHGSWII
jgi:hypothetical protein